MQISDEDFDRELKNRSEQLLSCQREKELNSCFDCDKLVGCEIREAYVKSVYGNMNKGEGSDFEF